MDLPISASEDIKPHETGKKEEPVIKNPHFGKEFLTQFEAIDSINWLSAALMADYRMKGKNG